MDRRFKPLLILLTIFSLSFTFVAAYANTLKPPPDPLATLQGRTEVTDPETVVSVVRVDNDNVTKAVERAIMHLGGIETIVRQGDKVLIKPNLVTNQSAPVTTDPRVVEAIVKLVKPRASKVWIAEGSAYPWEIGNTMKNFATLGYTEVANRTGAELVDLNQVDGANLVNVTVPDGIAFKQFTLNHVLVEADVFISVPCLKTHVVSVVTLGMKNLVGITPAPLYGWVPGPPGYKPGPYYTDRKNLHEGDYEVGGPYPGTHMAAVITDLCKARRINLTIIDGILGMEGLGPTFGTPVQMNLIIAGKDPVATDSVACAIIGFDPEKVPSTKWGAEKGLGTNDLHKIEVKGEQIIEVFHPFAPASGTDPVSLGYATDHQDYQFARPSADYKMLYDSRVALIYLAVTAWGATFLLFLVLKKWQRPSLLLFEYSTCFH